MDQYTPVVAGLENDIDEIEDQFFSGDPDVSKRIFGLQREVIDLQHATSPLVDMFDRMQADRDGVHRKGGGSRLP